MGEHRIDGVGSVEEREGSFELSVENRGSILACFPSVVIDKPNGAEAETVLYKMLNLGISKVILMSVYEYLCGLKK